MEIAFSTPKIQKNMKNLINKSAYYDG